MGGFRVSGSFERVQARFQGLWEVQGDFGKVPGDFGKGPGAMGGCRGPEKVLEDSREAAGVAIGFGVPYGAPYNVRS